MAKQHHYSTNVQWTGNRGTGTSGYKSYDRAHTIQATNKPAILASSDPVFMGDAGSYNHEEFLVASLSSCHMLWYLHLCADNGIIVTAYEDNVTGMMEENQDGGKFIEVTLNPRVTITDVSMVSKAIALHSLAHAKCFIANSVNFPVRQQPEVSVG